MLRILSAVPKLTVTALIILAIVNLLVGVILRYFVGAITDWLDVDPVPFTWVEEVGELSLAWLTLIGAAIGLRSRSHFALSVFVHRLPEAAQLWIHRFNHALITGFGLLAA
jgi:TRAP-type C4-dicarboxylate transport system permease small subunit